MAAVETRCDLIRLERSNMVTKMEDRIKIGLVEMSQVILENLRLCDSVSLPHTPDTMNRLAVQFNQGALLQYQCGEIEKAETLCHAAIKLFARLASETEHRALCLAKMVAPYINFARIHGQKGEVAESLNIFEDMYRFGLQQQDLSMFGHRIPVADGPAIFEVEPYCQKLMLSCRVLEEARVYQVVEDYPGLLALAERNESLPEFQDAFYRQYLLELRSRALVHMGRYEMAMEALQKCLSQMPANSIDRVVAHLLLSQLYREWGRDESARTTLDKLEGHLAALEKFSQRLPVLRQVAYRLALERYAMGDASKALEPAEKSFKICSELSDQPGSMKSAMLLLRVCTDAAGGPYPAEMQRCWYDELQRLASESHFRLERACAYWELGLSADLMEPDGASGRETACEFLQNSYNLYHSVPFVDSRQSCEAVKRSLESRGREFPARGARAGETVALSNPSIDSVYDLLMEYVPEAVVATR
jgi:tetratricopeptide (TPR) repeat protein